jgi:hypothetical protein
MRFRSHPTFTASHNEAPGLARATSAVDAGPRGARCSDRRSCSLRSRWYSAAFSPLSSVVVRAIHVGFLLLMTFALFPGISAKRQAGLQAGVAWLHRGRGLPPGLLPLDLRGRPGAARRRPRRSSTWGRRGHPRPGVRGRASHHGLGPAAHLRRLPGLCLFGQYLPGALAHRGYGLDQIVDQLGFGTEGIYGIPTYVSSTYIFLFILFGAFLEQAGMIRLFTDFAMGTVGHTRGGPAKVSVISSGLMGTINGSGVANVVTTGQFTIPLMKRFGYSPAFAGGVEATSSMGGQIMPPVMGAVAFIMAETIDVPYIEICKAAIIPALLYFASAFWMVHLEAGRKGLHGLPKAECPDPWAPSSANWHLFLPLVGLVYAAVLGLHAAVLGHRRPGADRGADLRRGSADQACRAGRCASSSGWRWAWASPARARLQFGVITFFTVVALLVVLCAMCAGAGARRPQAGANAHGRGRDARAAGGHCLCAGGHDHRHHHADRLAADLGGHIIAIGREKPVPGPGADHADLPGAGHGHSDHPELHHHQLAGGAGFAGSWACR